MKKSDFIKKYGLDAYQRKLEAKKQWREANKAEIAEYNKRWREKNAEYDKRYRQEHKVGLAEYNKQWRETNKTEIAEYNKQYSKTPMGRASKLVRAYKQEDKKHNRGDCTLTSKWVLDNIFTSKCIYCGESDWKQLGCDRIDNNLPHTEDNVVCCCGKCNVERHTTNFDEFIEKKRAV